MQVLRSKLIFFASQFPNIFFMSVNRFCIDPKESTDVAFFRLHLFHHQLFLQQESV